MIGPKKLDICLTPKSDKHLISPYNIIPESCSKVKRKRKLPAAIEVVDCHTNSPCQYLREYMENSMENTFTDIRV